MIKKPISKVMSESFWYSDPAQLFTSQNWMKFVPTETMKVPEALNAIVRFTVYFAGLLAILTGKTYYLLFIPVVMVGSIVVNSLYPETQTFKETFAGRDKTAPKPSNPFMNVVFTDYVDNPDRPPAPSNINASPIKEDVASAYAKTSDIFMDTADAFGRMQSIRNFTTNPATTIPNDLDAYQTFLNQHNVSRKLDSESYVAKKGSVFAYNPHEQIGVEPNIHL
jgi:hypothetical protein